MPSIYQPVRTTGDRVSTSNRSEVTMPMTEEQSAQVEDLLQVWYAWTMRYRPPLGAPKASIYARGSESSDVYVDADEIDVRIEAEQARQVDACIDMLSTLHKSVVGIHAANSYVGSVVFRNPRLTVEATHILYLEAKQILFTFFAMRRILRL
jgi:hypothetical protein